MKQELIKPVIRLGNSAGVVLPKEWYGGKARIELVEKPFNIQKETLEILQQYLYDIQGIYLVGSYARKEQTEKSDIDILVITNKTNKQLKQGKYNLLLISKKEMENSLKNNILPILPMLREAKVLLNESLILGYKKTLLTKKNLRWHFETTKSAMKMNKAVLEIGGKMISDNIIYSLILRLRELYIVDCLMHNKKSSTTEFLKLVKKITNSISSYGAYIRLKNDERVERVTSFEDATKIYGYIIKKIEEQVKWVAERKN
ncbi:MAG: nucleotidyltransferase domain-containing protein [Nanoarchaeota archaeon]|nr:nucleotidyltransferase domain-containing protein [Nanoarchaeota archaeon]MBU4116856.1 nucleotidyltransferase domain-containing protein [Nanoarchaeota archaeon]